MPGRRAIRWVRQWGGSDRVVWINVAKLDAAWRAAEPDFYLGLGGGPMDGIHYRYARFGRWLAHLQGRVWMPHIGIYEGGVSFTDGRIFKET